MDIFDFYWKKKKKDFQASTKDRKYAPGGIKLQPTVTQNPIILVFARTKNLQPKWKQDF